MFEYFAVRRLARRAWAALTQPKDAVAGLLKSSPRRRMEAERQIIQESLLFDSNWYLETYPDVARAGVDPIKHYLSVGWQEGRDPGPTFTTSAYLKANEDVVRAGINPLLHFVQFGRAEGRQGFGDRLIPPSPVVKQVILPDAHACLSFPRASRSASVWRRGYRLNRDNPGFVAAGKAPVGYASDKVSRAAVEAGVEWLRCLSGFRRGDFPGTRIPPFSSCHSLVDAWYVNAAQLRTRWSCGTFPMVVRAFQCEPAGGGTCLVGEGAVASPTDFVDLHLRNPYFPILFALADLEGDLSAIGMLSFPSLCRGGTHYPELLWAAGRRPGFPPDVAAVSDDLTKELIALLRGEAKPAVRQIEVASAGSDQNGPLFRRDLRAWLTSVLSIEILDSSQPESGSQDGQSAVLEALGARMQRASGGKLALAADTAPTISALVAAQAGPDRQPTARPAPLLISRLDPSRPAMVIKVPRAAGRALDAVGSELPWFVPSEGGSAPDFPAAAVRMSQRQELSDAQLLVPLSSPALRQDRSRPAITWLIDPDEWADVRLLEAIRTLGLQRGADGDVLALVGPSSSARLALARKRFAGEAFAFKSRSEAVRYVKTPIAGYVAGGILVHDAGTADYFTAMLSNDLIATVSCVIVAAEKRAGVVKTVIVDGGALVRADGEPAAPNEGAAVAAELWQGTYPVLRPSPYLWATRSDLMLAWDEGRGGEMPEGAIHLCSSSVTASLVKKGASAPQLPGAPEASRTRAEVEWLAG
jgi:hypothetical protein